MDSYLSEKHSVQAARDAGSQISLLIEIGQLFGRELSAQLAFKQLLDILKKRHGVIRGLIVLFDNRTQKIRIRTSIGLDDAGTLVSYRPGEGITGRVCETGKAMAVPCASAEPRFLNRAAKRDFGKQEITYICVPIILQARTIGALGIDLPFVPDRDYDCEVRLLSLIAAMMAHAIKSERSIDDERRRLKRENSDLLAELRGRYDFSKIIAAAEPMRRVFEQIAQVAHTNTSVLIRGESGTGKELIAHAIHYNSPRGNKPFVKVNCAALPETLVESELYGYEKGAFTDAHAMKKGRFEMAEGGTLFLDEVGDMSLSTQIKLLRVLQEKEFDRLGGTASLKSNVRLIAGTNKNLEKAVVEGKFREDLYFRLNVFSIVVPALRERTSDLPLLTEHFLKKYAAQLNKDVRRISTSAIDMLRAYHWPGNVRELENVIERALLVCDKDVLEGHHLPPTLQTAQASGTVTAASFSDSIAAYEKDLILDALRTSRGNRSKAAILLGTTERIISYRVRKYKIDIHRFRAQSPAGE